MGIFSVIRLFLINFLLINISFIELSNSNEPIFNDLKESQDSSIFPQKFCEEELNKMMLELLKQDKNGILVEYFNIAALKLSRKIIRDNGANDNVENFIKTKMNKLSSADKANLAQKISELYNQYGKQTDQSKIAKILEDLDDHSYYPKSKRLSNEDHSVIMLAYKVLDPCKSSALCINENDVSITWFMDKLSKKANKEVQSTSTTNMLEMSVKVANLVGGINLGEDREMKAHSEDELESMIRAKTNKVNLQLENFKTSFIMQFEECESLITGSCGVSSIKTAMNNSMNQILSELDKNKIQRIPASGKLQIINGLTLNLNNSLEFKVEEKKVNLRETPDNYPGQINFPAELISGEKGPNSCGGEPFTPEIDNINLFTFDPLRTVGNLKKFGDSSKKYNMVSTICEMLKVGPIGFHCYTFMKKLVIRLKKADAKVCCEDKVNWEPFVNLYAGISGGAEVKGYLGIPLLNKIGLAAEIGLLGGISGGITIGGGEVPEGCINKKCIQAAIRTSIYIGAYVDVGLKRTAVLDGAGMFVGATNLKDKNINQNANNKNSVGYNLIGGELKLALKPYITGRQCLYPSNELPPAEIKYSIGSVWIQGTIEMGWMFWWDVYELAYKNENEDSVSIPIF
jgi:phenylpyruvate tautomerase PptA (4-oxalocrotonate tautomerase family)